MTTSLWGEEFVVEDSVKKTKKVVSKTKEPKQASTKKVKKVDKDTSTTDIKSILDNIYKEVYRILGRYAENTVLIKTKQQLHEYIDAAIDNKVIAIDTETDNSLDPLTCKLMGPCIYTPGRKNAYIPINHVDLDTRARLDWQLTEEDIKEEFLRLSDTDIIMHNGKFDYQVIKCTTSCELNIYWDTLVAAKVLDENEYSAGLKQQYISKIDSSIEKYSIEDLFEDIEYAIVDPEVFALYAATDAFMTFRLYEYQKKQFEKVGNERLYELFSRVEMPIVIVAADMELTGVSIDKEYAARLSVKYHEKLDVIDQKIADEMSKYKDTIDSWRLTPDATYKAQKINKKGEIVYAKSKSEQLEDPINMASPTQLAILIYDVLKHPVVDKKSPRGTGEEILVKIKLPICQLILERRGLDKLIGTYIDKIPKLINPATNRVHTHFQQYGAATGRFSSSDPINLQNIPSHNKEIRMIFKAEPGNTFVGSDFSQQEPRLLATYSNDESMIGAYKDNKDLYATIAQKVYKNDYWDNMEFTQDGKPNPAGKKRRGSCKSLLLGIMYGRGAASVAEQIGGTIEEANSIINAFYETYPKVKSWMDRTLEGARTNGYVEDLWGRRRRLPDIQLDKYQFIFKDSSLNPTFNPLIGSKGIYKSQNNIIIEKYKKLLNNCKTRKDIQSVKNAAENDGIHIRDNSGFISQAERQCVNARIQGGAATMSKKAMILIHKDEELKNLGFKLIIAVHDELIGECPKEHQDACADRLSYLMRTCVPELDMPFKCDATIEDNWYYSDYSASIKAEYADLIKGGMNEEDAQTKIFKNHFESEKDILYDIMNNIN